MFIEVHFQYSESQKPFFDYFERMKSAGYSFKDIESQLPYIEKYWNGECSDNWWSPTLTDFFNRWQREMKLLVEL